MVKMTDNMRLLDIPRCELLHELQQEVERQHRRWWWLMVLWLLVAAANFVRFLGDLL